MSHKAAKKGRLAKREPIVLKAYTRAMAHTFKTASRPQIELIAQMHTHYVAQFEGAKKMMAAIGQEVQPEGLAAGIHVTTDTAIYNTLAAMHPEITCGAHCSHCCYIHVSILPAEAKLLAHHVREGKYAANLDRARVQAEVLADPERDEVQKWKRLAYEDRACMFLRDDGNCGCYADRPSMCRNHMSTDDPSHCDTRVPRTDVRYFVAIEAETLLNAAHCVWGKPVSLPIAMLKEIEEEM
jgi:Fe-S-cluster containining protein